MLTKVLDQVLEGVHGAADLRRNTDCRQFPNGKNEESFHVPVIRTSKSAECKACNLLLHLCLLLLHLLSSDGVLNMNIQKAV